MRYLSLLALILTSLSLGVSAQDYKPPKSKPYHSASKEKPSKSAVADKKLTSANANSQALRHVEQQTAKSSAGKAAKRQARPVRVRTEHDKPNPPIHISSAGGTHAGMNDQGKNPYKGRVRQKGNH